MITDPSEPSAAEESANVTEPRPTSDAKAGGRTLARRTAAAEGIAARDTTMMFGRELSWLAFNERVLSLAEDPATPLLERAKFLAIFSSNLDEFFQVRVSALSQQKIAGFRSTTRDGLALDDLVRDIREYVARLMERESGIFRDAVLPELAGAGIRLTDWAELDADDRETIREEFTRRLFPVLTPLAVDPAHPFPYISNLSLNLAVVVREPNTYETRFARVKVPPLLPRFITLPDHQRFVPIEQVIAAHLELLFPGMEIVEQHVFRVTRDADVEPDDEADDLLIAMERVLRRRSKFGIAVRLEIDPTMTPEIRKLLCEELDLDEASDVYEITPLLDLTGLFAIAALPRPELCFPEWIPRAVPEFADDAGPDGIFGILRERDVLVHHPYDSFASSVEAFLEQAARDPDVLAIKQTLYRGAGPQSANVRALIHAAQSGKQVVAMVELKARFDEAANIERARALEQAGVHVVYGVVGLKTHAKIVLVVRQEQERIRRYCHIGTGNYNPKTADLYEDIGIFTSDETIAADVTELFNSITGYSRRPTYRRLIVAPQSTRNAILERIQAQAALGNAGRIILKMNGLVDSVLIEAILDAARAGVDIDLIIRGICCLNPADAGPGARLEVRSILGRFLEHSRIFRFGADPETAEYLIGSADLMPRNLDNRVEAHVPVIAPELRARLDQILDVELSPDTTAWILGGDGIWKQTAVGGQDAQQALIEDAMTREREGDPR
jgi:polyphosphate kinase